MSRVLLNGNAAAAWGARLAAVDYVPAFPITPQTEIIETLAAWRARGEIAARMTTYESEHSMLTGAAAAAASGVRVFTATSSQGLLYAMEMVFAAPGWRAPFVLVNVSRALASPITLEPDHTDVLAARDSGFIQIHCATCQEVVDGVLMAYRLGEDSRVRLPVLVNQDGFHLSFTREPVELPDADAAKRFLPPFDPHQGTFSASRPISQVVAVLGGSAYSYFRYQVHLAQRAALGVFEEIAGDFANAFGRRYHAVETYRADDADVVFFMIGAFVAKAKHVVDRMREGGVRVGVVRPRLMRPFPDAALRDVLRGKRAVAVVDQNLSMGMGGVLHAELSGALMGHADMPLLVSFIGGLGGRDIGDDEFVAMAQSARAVAESGRVPEPRLLYTATELRELRKLQTIAGAGKLHEAWT